MDIIKFAGPLIYSTSLPAIVGPVSSQTNFKMADRKGLTIWTMFITAKYKVNAANNMSPVLKDVFTKCTPNSRGWRVETNGSIDMAVPNQVSYMTLSQVIHVCDAAQVHFPGKEW